MFSWFVRMQARRLPGIMNWRRAACAQESSMLSLQPQTAQMKSPGSDDLRRHHTCWLLLVRWH